MARPISTFGNEESGVVDFDLTDGEVPVAIDLGEAEIEQRVNEFVAHVDEIALHFNLWARETGLGVQMSATALKSNPTALMSAVQIYFDNSGLGGKLHLNQLKTVIDTMCVMIRQPTMCGVILGALQAGKTGTSNGLQMFGPVNYLLTGLKIYPMYLVTSLTNHEAQSKDELKRFLVLYSQLEFMLGAKRCTLLEYRDSVSTAEIQCANPVLPAAPSINAMFKRSPSIQIYRDVILAGAVQSYKTLSADELIHRRVHGKAVRELADFVKNMKLRGFDPLFIVDEAQHGASDWIEKKKDGTVIKHVCVLKQMLKELKAAMKQNARFVCLSATLFEANDLESMWRVNQYLPDGYVGFNMFLGKHIDDSKNNILPPKVLRFVDYGERVGAGSLQYINMALIRSKNHQRFVAWANKVGYARNPKLPLEDQFFLYCRAVRRSIREMIYQTIERANGLAKNGKGLGICIRVANDNVFTREFIAGLRLDPNLVDVIRFFDQDGRKLSVRQYLMKQRAGENGKPFVIFVTNKARMGDAFPIEVELFVDSAQHAGDINALLQGLLGRACGVNKNTTVLLSDENVHTVEAYLRDKGRMRGTMSRHSTPIGTSGRSSKFSILKIDQNHDPVVREFLDWVNTEIVDKHVKQKNIRMINGEARLTVPRDKLGKRYAPIFDKVNQLGLFDYIENNQSEFFPNVVSRIRVVRANEEVAHSRKPNVKLRYDQNTNGVNFTFRRNDKIGGVGGRGKGQRDSRTDRARTDGALQPQVNVVYENGRWKCFMVTFPLHAMVEDCPPGLDYALPRTGHAFDDDAGPGMSEAERIIRDQAEAA